MRVIYADSMFLLNFIIDYLLLLATAKICALPLCRWRMALAAVWGGLYAVLSVLHPELFALATSKIFSGLAVAAIAFGGLGRFARSAIVFFAVSAAFGGAVYAALSLGGLSPGSGPVAAVSMRTLVLSFALCYAALSLVFHGIGRRAQREVRSVEVSLRGLHANFRALRDTGNELRDSKGAPIIAAEWEVIAPLFPELPMLQSTDPPEMLLKLSSLPEMEGRCRLLPCMTATNPSGLLLLIRPDSLLIDGEASAHNCIAVIPGPLSPDSSYRGLF